MATTTTGKGSSDDDGIPGMTQGRGAMDPSKGIHFACPQVQDLHDAKNSYTMIVTKHNKDVVIGYFEPITEPTEPLSQVVRVVTTAHRQIMDTAGLNVETDLLCGGAIHVTRNSQSQLPEYNAEWRSWTINGKVCRVRDMTVFASKHGDPNFTALLSLLKKRFLGATCTGAMTTRGGCNITLVGMVAVVVTACGHDET